MPTLSAREAKAKLYRLLEQVALTHEPVLITGRQTNAVLISEEDWRSIEETMYLLSIPGMRQSIIEGLNTPTEDCDKEIE
jgi:prevent-host-death family protein